MVLETEKRKRPSDADLDSLDHESLDSGLTTSDHRDADLETLTTLDAGPDTKSINSDDDSALPLFNLGTEMDLPTLLPEPTGIPTFAGSFEALRPPPVRYVTSADDDLIALQEDDILLPTASTSSYCEETSSLTRYVPSHPEDLIALQEAEDSFDLEDFITVDEIGESDTSAELELHPEDDELFDTSRDSSVPPEASSSPRRPSRKFFCPVCHTRLNQRVRRHIEMEHVPWWLSPNRACWRCHGTTQSSTFTGYRHEICGSPVMTDRDIPTYVELANGLLQTLMEALNCSTHEQLLAYVIKNQLYPQSSQMMTMSYPQKMFVWLWERGNHLDYTPFERMSFSPPASIGCLLHHKVIACILGHLPADSPTDVMKDRREKWLSQHRRRLVRVADAHCHLENSKSFQIYEGDRWDGMLRVTVAISNFVFPTTLRKLEEWMTNPKVYGTVGLHPVSCQSTSNIVHLHKAQLLKCLQHPKCVAIGELGLDYLRGPTPELQQRQRDNLIALLALRPSTLPIVIHCREGLQTPKNQAVDDLLTILDQHVPSHVKLYFHCFEEDSTLRDKILQIFPHAYFGINPKVMKLGEQQQEEIQAMLRGLPLERILLETDYPFLSMNPRTSLYDTASWVGLAKGMCPTLILEATRRSTLHFYNIPDSIY